MSFIWRCFFPVSILKKEKKGWVSFRGDGVQKRALLTLKIFRPQLNCGLGEAGGQTHKARVSFFQHASGKVRKIKHKECVIGKRILAEEKLDKKKKSVGKLDTVRKFVWSINEINVEAILDLSSFPWVSRKCANSKKQPLAHTMLSLLRTSLLNLVFAEALRKLIKSNFSVLLLVLQYSMEVHHREHISVSVSK